MICEQMTLLTLILDRLCHAIIPNFKADDTWTTNQERNLSRLLNHVQEALASSIVWGCALLLLEDAYEIG